jgi:repressor LexA
MQGLTDRQQQVLHYIRQSIHERGYPPTLREIGAHMGIRSTNGVNDHLRALERKGYLTREDMKSRALRPRDVDDPRAVAAVAANVTNTNGTNGANGANGANGLPNVGGMGPAYGGVAENDQNGDILEIPVLGRIAAGLPLLAEEHVLDTVRIERNMVRGGREIFGLKVTGDSMIEAGILSGDYIFVRKQITAQRGDIVVALIGDEATVKYYFPEKDYIRFQPANAAMAPILVRAADFKPTMLLGVVVGVYRRL